jgi:hypothetical protein
VEVAMAAERDHRPKASEVFRDSNSFFAGKTTFRESFPTIKAARVEVTESDSFGWNPGEPRVYTESTLGEYIDCHKRLCYNGGFSIGDLLRDMVTRRETDRPATKMCQGDEASPKGRKIYRKCRNAFSIQIHIDYHPVHINPADVS